MSSTGSIVMNKSARYWNRSAERYAEQPIPNAKAYQKKLRLTQHYLTPESNVLEFGCGTGSTALRHAPKVNHILALDYSHAMIRIANRRLADKNFNNVQFKCATLFDLAESDASFDAVLGLNVLHLIEHYQSSIRKAYELLKPGGVFVTSTVCMSSRLSPLKPVLSLCAALGLVPRVEFLTEDDLERAITECGFELVEKLPPMKPSRSTFLIATKA